jgi:hypothetical protein
MSLSVKIAQAAHGYVIHIDGDSAHRLDPERIDSFLRDRLACAHANQCLNNKEQRVAQRVDCLKFLADRRFTGISHSHRDVSQVQVQKTDTGLQVQCSGEAFAKLGPLLNQRAIEKRLQTISSCSASHRCNDEKQTLVDRFKCVTTLSEQRFA